VVDLVLLSLGDALREGPWVLGLSAAQDVVLDLSGNTEPFQTVGIFYWGHGRHVAWIATVFQHEGTPHRHEPWRVVLPLPTLLAVRGNAPAGVLDAHCLPCVEFAAAVLVTAALVPEDAVHDSNVERDERLAQAP
jgi:hypothetical protein